jgi:DNA-directed RNA polymerase subunit RPC12/RpoP
MKKILTSLSLTILVGCLFGIFFKSFSVFAIAIILQFLFFYFFNSAYENLLVQRVVTANIDLEKAKIKNTLEVTCPCGSKQDVLLSFTEDTIYRCEECKNEVRVAVNIGTALVTNPIFTKK